MSIENGVQHSIQPNIKLDAEMQHFNVLDSLLVYSGNSLLSHSTDYHEIPIHASRPLRLRLLPHEYTTHCYTWITHTTVTAT